ncbi:hypothetical protein Ae201684P_002535 [Aphanomyces euteiches]|nr:hypothetical protein Ae201684P_002535 [Aphanomyces euteiches]
METLLKQITTYDVHAPWSEQLQALADIKAVVEQVLQVDSRDAVVDTLTILTEPFKTDCWIESIRTDVVHRARGFLSGLATTCGFALGQFVDDVMVSLIDAARSHVKKICQAGDDCVAVLASPSRYDLNKLIHTFDKVRGVRVRAREGTRHSVSASHETCNISQVKSYLSSEFGAGRTDSVLTHSHLFPPASQYANEAVAKLWLDTVVGDYAKFAGVSICKGGAGQAVGHGMPMLMQSFAAAAPVENVPDVDIIAAYGLKAFLAPKFATYNKPGKYLTSTIVKLLSAKLPGGFSASQLRVCMAQERYLGPKRIKIALIHSLANAPDARFATEADAKTWVNLAMDEYGSVFSVPIPYALKAGGAVIAGVPMMGGGVSSAALDALKTQMHTMMREQVNAYQAFRKFDSLATLKKTNADQVARREKQIDLWVSERGEYDEKGIQPKFDAKKIRIYGSYWKGVKQDALYYRTLANVEGVKIGARASKLILFPFNQASSKDRGALVAHIYEQLNLDLVIPFDAISGPTLSDIDSKSELAHCIMLTNTYRMLGKIIDYKGARNTDTRPCFATLSLSPNHGTMGGGLYAEAKLGLEALMNKWHSEGCEHYLTGAVIGWTRGTGLMAGNNNVSVGIEKLGVRTFRHVEMAFDLTSILHPRMVAAAAKSPLWVDSGGGMAQLHDLKIQTDTIRTAITDESKIRRASVDDRLKGSVTDVVDAAKPVWNRDNMYKDYAQLPDLPAASELATLGKNYKGMINLEKTVVVVGFGQVGPWGNSRWEVESYGKLSLESCVEFAWILGCIKYHIGPLQSGQHYIGWVDAKTQDPVADTQVKSLYAENILKHSGIRVVEPELFEGYDPKKKIVLQQVDKNMRPIEVASREEGLESQKKLGEDNCDVFDGSWMLRLRQGAVLSKNLHFNRWVVGQIPIGGDAVVFWLTSPKRLTPSLC